MMVLFLGGPWHNERHEVSPTRSSWGAVLPAHFTVLATDDSGGDVARPLTPTRRRVTYLRRYARAGGERLPVYVSPDYDGPARA